MKNIFKSDLIPISDSSAEYYIRLSDINGIKKVYSHPNNTDDTKGYPKYQVYLKDGAWSWVLITVSDFDKYIKPYVNFLKNE